LLERQDDDATLVSFQVFTDLSAYASPHPAFDRMRFLFTMSEIEGQKETATDRDPVRRPFGLRHAKR